MFSKPASWKWSLLAAAIVTYAPFALLCLFMLAFERQWGNTMTAVGLLPEAPGIMPTMCLDHLVGSIAVGPWRFDPFPYWMRRPSVYAMAVAIIIAVASLGRLGREWLVGGATAAFFINGIAAYWLPHAIRM